MKKLNGDGWFIRKGEGHEGPFSARQLSNMALAGKLTGEDYLWQDGFTAWIKADGFENLFSTPDSNQDYKGLSGWLYIVGLGLLGTIFRGIISIVVDVNILLTYTVAQPFYATLLTEIVLHTLLSVVVPIWLGLLFLNEKQSFKRYYVQWMWVFLVFILIEGAAGFILLPNQRIKTIASTLYTVAGVIIWTLYMRRSKRVEATFVNP